jgi:hypothetical protein
MRCRVTTAVGAFALSACATGPQLHSEAQLNVVARSCGLALGELVQEEDAQKLLFIFRIAPSAQQRSCVFQWARRNRMRPVVIEAVTEPAA